MAAQELNANSPALHGLAGHHSDRHGNGHDDHHDDSHGEEGPHSTLSGYLTGFVLSVVLTVIPFGVVMLGMLSRELSIAVITVCAVAQILVHMVFFLHLNSKSEGGWTMLSLLFTAVVLGIALAGTIWVMYNMNMHMMPHVHGQEVQSGQAIP